MTGKSRSQGHRTASYAEQDLTGWSFKGKILRGANFRDADCTGADFSDADIQGASFANATLVGAKFNCARAGLQSHWATVLACCCWVASCLSGFVMAFTISMIGLFPFLSEELSTPGPFNGVYFTLVLLMIISTFLLSIRQIEKIRLDFIVTVLSIFIVVAITLITIAPNDINLGNINTRAIIIILFILPVLLTTTASALLLESLIWVITTAIAQRWVSFVVLSSVILGAVQGAQIVLKEISGEYRLLVLPVVGILVLVSRYIGRQALGENTKYSLIHRTAVLLTSWRGTCFKGADLTRADMTEADLRNTSLDRANLNCTCWYFAKNLNLAFLEGSYLKNLKIRSLVVEKRPRRRDNDFSFLNLRGLNLEEAELQDVNFSGTDLSESNLQSANLLNATLLETQFYRPNLRAARLTGACIQDWKINSATNLEDVDCDYVYLQTNQQERRPHNGDCAPGRFVALFQKALETVDLLFSSEISWQAFFQAIQALQAKYGINVAIQAIEKKRDEALVIRLEVSSIIDKAHVKLIFDQEYEAKIRELKAHFQQELRVKDKEIEFYQHKNADLMRTIASMGLEALKNRVINNTFYGPIHGTAYQENGNSYYTEAEKQFLAETAAEIQSLLKQLEATNPSDTEAEQDQSINQ